MTADDPMPESLEALLADVMCGDRDESDPEVVAAVREHPVFARELAAMRATMAELDATGENERETLAAAEAEPAAVPAAGSSGPSVAMRVGLALAAAALLVVAVRVFWPREISPGHTYLNQEVGIAVTAEAVELDFELPAMGWVSIEVRDPGGALVTSVEDLQSLRWPLDEAARASWPPVVTILATVHDGAGVELADGSLELHR